MTLPQLTKEQKQALILIVMVTAGGIFALVRFVFMPAMDTFKESKDELKTIQAKLEKAEKLIDSEATIREELAQTAEELLANSEQHMPPEANALSWATERIYQSARSTGVELESVALVGGSKIPWRKSKKLQRVFVPFAVRIMTQCSYFDLVKLIEAIEESNPYVSISSIAITASSQAGGLHRITIEVEWLTWKSGKSKDWIKRPDEKK